ncbi:MAG: DUF3791 domain-containing protein [Bacteroidales bacterium]|nr:DUF3791 domain-containing protein [Bacteroidales bacterium]
MGSVAERLDLPLATVYRRVKDSNIIDGYLVPGYDPLHTFSREYITDEVIDFMKKKGNGIAVLHCCTDERPR